MENLFQMNLTPAQVNQIPNLSLALVGDGVYELLCRTYLSAKDPQKVLQLHKQTVAMVKAPTQAAYADLLKPYLTAEELDYYRRGKNSHTHAAPKSATPQQYAKATGLEALFGALYLLGQTQRLNELFHIIISEETNHGI